MPLFNVAVREHAYTGLFYSDVVEAGSGEEALQLAAERATAPRPPPPGSEPRRGSDGVVREHAYPGRSYNDVVAAGSGEEALEHAAERATAPRPPPGPGPRRRSNVVVTEHAYPGRSYNDVTVTAGSCEEALQLAAELAAAPRPPPGSGPQPDAANRRRCADVWVYSVLHCELADGHDPPHMAVAPGYRRPMRWVRDDRGLAREFPPVPLPGGGG